MPGPGVTDAVVRALKVASEHPAVVQVGDPTVDETTGWVSAEITFEVSLPNAWRAQGQSPSGVCLHEDVRFDFPPGFPLAPPTPTLRLDFTRDLAHIQPWVIDGRPVPCLYDGRLSELLQQQGMLGILNQTAIWLDKAAEGKLIDPKHGWEPTRRDDLDDFLIADATAIRALVKRDGGHKFFDYHYLRIACKDGRSLIHGQIRTSGPKLNPANVPNIFAERPIGSDGKHWHGASVALVVWPGKLPSGDLIISNTYAPETVSDVEGLETRAALYGCASELETGLNWLTRCVSGFRSESPFSLAVILCARRPINIIGEDSPVELCPYVVDFHAPGVFQNGGATPVRPAGHRHHISRSLLARMAGESASLDQLKWTLVGAGSLGSKIALHLGRAGRGPTTVVDRSSMNPHNAARHALVPSLGDMQLFWMEAKARLLANALGSLDQMPIAITEDVINIVQSKEQAKQAWSKRAWAVVNSTASLAAREAFAAAPHSILPTRVIEAALYARGRLGVVMIEGPGRDPNIGDLTAELYAMLREDDVHRRLFFGKDGGQLSRSTIGEGCGSLTMIMSDGRLSIFAASMSEYLLEKQSTGLPEASGEILIGTIDEDGLGLAWNKLNLPSVTAVNMPEGSNWCVHIHSRALAKIQAEVARWPDVETGGVLVGRLSEVSRTFHVVDVIAAPEDSTRTPAEFVIGTKGLRTELDAYAESTGWALYCLGTWHSHLAPSVPSPTDRATARTVALARVAPSVLLVHTPEGFHALLADAASAGEDSS